MGSLFSMVDPFSCDNCAWGEEGDYNTHLQSIHWFNAIGKGNIQAVATILAHDPSIIDRIMPDGDRALHSAVRQNNMNLVFFLLESGNADPDARNTDLETPLHVAIRCDTVGIVSLLLCRYADPTEQDGGGMTAIELARDHSNKEIMVLLDQMTTPREEQSVFDLTVDIGERKTNEGERGHHLDSPRPTLQCRKSTTAQCFEVLDKYQPRDTPLLEDSASLSRNSQMNQLSEKSKDLLDLSGWLHKKKSKAPFNWHKRWFIVRGSYILWSHKEIDTRKPTRGDQRARFHEAVSMMIVRSIDKIESGQNNQFQIKIIGREYTFRADTTENRDYWVDNLKKHKDFYKRMASILE